jgi:Na+-driven multidrug efflux pump
MSGGVAAEVIAILAMFLGGVACGVVVIVSRAIKREDRKRSLTERAPDAAARGARVLTGVGSRDISPPER